MGALPLTRAPHVGSDGGRVGGVPGARLDVPARICGALAGSHRCMRARAPDLPRGHLWSRAENLLYGGGESHMVSNPIRAGERGLKPMRHTCGGAGGGRGLQFLWCFL
jgi:hypothetical protein